MDPASSEWYKQAVIYQIYPRSFADGNGDGVGDLPGIIGKLDYLQDLGVDALWLSPIYQSPMADFGYDVSDYEAIDPLFGSLDDFDRLVAGAHARGLKLLMDFVPNHTSDRHPWFEASAGSRDNPKRDWYIWRDTKPDGSEPNNWQSVFGGPAWTYDERTGQYYLHSFLKEQPDLNWANPEVQAAVQDIMRFWYARGVDGFRVDAILFTAKDLALRDNAEQNDASNAGEEHEKVFNHGVGEHLGAYIKVLSDVSKEYPGRCLFLEAYPDSGDPAGYAQLYGYMQHDVAAPFYFGLFGATYDWRPETLRHLVNDFQALLPSDAFSVYVLGNHDVSRLASRLDPRALRAVAVLLMTLPGAKFIYYGDELGMADVDIPTELRQDPSNVPRDPERTPMPWTSGPNAGFSTNEPWLPVGPDAETQNVQIMSADPTSILELYRELIALHRLYPALKGGSFVPMTVDNVAVYGFRRCLDGQQVLVLINFADYESKVNLPLGNGQLVVSSTYGRSGVQGNLSRLTLMPNEAVIIKIDT